MFIDSARNEQHTNKKLKDKQAFHRQKQLFSKTKSARRNVFLYTTRNIQGDNDNDDTRFEKKNLLM